MTATLQHFFTDCGLFPKCEGMNVCRFVTTVSKTNTRTRFLRGC